jgi:hypothetical protein
MGNSRTRALAHWCLPSTRPTRQFGKEARRDKFKANDNWEQIAGNYNRIAVSNFSGLKFFGFLPPLTVRGKFKQAIENGDFGGRFSNNELSFALLIEYQNIRIVLGGDVVGAHWSSQEKYENKTNVSVKSQISKVPHHGAKGDCNVSYVNCVFGEADLKSKRIAIVSANGTTHPQIEVFDLLHQHDVTTYCTNLPSFYQLPAQRLITDPNLDPVFVSTLNTHAEGTAQISEPCLGDIAVSIDAGGVINVQPQYNSLCPCHFP